MITFSKLMLSLSLLFTGLTLLGFIKPWYVLWWASHQNRLKVLAYYAVPACLAWLVYVYLVV